jgi:pyrimidine-specific ribonucleoside hydrolase
LLGDAGAMVLLTNPELFVTRELLVRVNLAGVDRGQTTVVQPAPPDDSAATDPEAWSRITVALDLDATQAASAFVKVIDSYTA